MRVSNLLPHRVCKLACYVNGLEDILAWKKEEYADCLISIVGGMAGFAHLRFGAFTLPAIEEE
jgi:hypothetical protein